jgi:hypothetical protein
MLARGELMRRVGRFEQVAGVRLATLGDGTERAASGSSSSGPGTVRVRRPRRPLFDVGRCELRGCSLARLSPVGVMGPWFAEPMRLGWLRMWGGGMLVTCGLDHTLLGGVDDASQFHQDVKPTEEYGLHGRIGFLPARLAGYGERWGDDCVLWAEGVVTRQRSSARRSSCAAASRRAWARAASSSATRSRTSASTRRPTCSSTT